MSKQEALRKCLVPICEAIDEDLKRRGAAPEHFNHPLNLLQTAVNDENVNEMKNLISHIVPAYFGRGERITGYLQNGIITVEQSNLLQSALGELSKELHVDEKVKEPIVEKEVDMKIHQGGLMSVMRKNGNSIERFRFEIEGKVYSGIELANIFDSAE